MITRVSGRTVHIKAENGYTFQVQADLTPVEVPKRDGTGDKKLEFFDMHQLLMEGRIPPTTNSDAAYAVLQMVRTWPDSRERDTCQWLLQRYLYAKKSERRDMAVIQMASLYGAGVATKISKGIRTHAFSFPAWWIREDDFAMLLNAILKYPGCASTSSLMPISKDGAITVATRFGGSKCACDVKKALNKLSKEDYINAVWRVAYYIETTM